jgi:hypothetical protein
MLFLDCTAYLDQEGAPTMRASGRGAMPVHNAVQPRADRGRHDQVPGPALVQRANRIPHLQPHAGARGEHCRSIVTLRAPLPRPA